MDADIKTQFEEKQEKVTEILEKINNKKKKTSTPLENEILELALQSRLHAEKAQKKKELTSELSKSFADLISKNDVKNARKTLKDSSAYEDAQEEIKTSRKVRKTNSDKQKVDKIKTKAVKVIEDCKKHITNDNDIEELRELLNRILKPKIDDKPALKNIDASKPSQENKELVAAAA